MSSNTESSTSQPILDRDVPENFRVLKRLSIGIFLVTAIYFLFYGPIVMNALNKYGNGGAVLHAVYIPAHLLANNNEVYGDYRLFWIKRSRNYHWWVRRNSVETGNVFHPPRQRNYPTAKTRYQPPPD